MIFLKQPEAGNDFTNANFYEQYFLFANSEGINSIKCHRACKILEIINFVFKFQVKVPRHYQH
jgi:hypothetical protein